MHLLGLVSHGGVHSHIDHLRALLELARREGMAERTWIHAFTDGRDVSPTSAVHDLAELPDARIATISGRYYAMDRDNRCERTDAALDAIFHRGHRRGRTAPRSTCVQRSYDDGRHRRVHRSALARRGPGARPGAKDAAIFFNFRPDRARQLSEKLGESKTDLTTMTKYREDFDFPVAFPEQTVDMVLAEVLAEHDVRQLHMAETEKYAHVTYFFNGGREEAFPGETRVLVPSPRDVPSYDQKPEMSAPELTDRFVSEIRRRLRVRGDQLREPGHGRPHRRDPGRGEGRRDRRRLPRPGRRGGAGAGRRLSSHGRPWKRGAIARGDGVSPHTAHTTNLGPLDCQRKGTQAARRWRAFRPRADGPRACSVLRSHYKWAAEISWSTK